LASGGDLAQTLREAAAGAEVLAVGGGDGSVNAAAGVAIEAGLPLLVLPGGTFNHFAADLGVPRRCCSSGTGGTSRTASPPAGARVWTTASSTSGSSTPGPVSPRPGSWGR